MKKSNIESKDLTAITMENKADIINTIVSAYFQTNEDGEIEYTPYLSKIGKVIAIAKYLIDGVTFDKSEKIYETAMADDEVKSLIDAILVSFEFNDIMKTVKDIVEYKKNENIARIQNESSLILSYKIFELINKEQEKIEKEVATIENLNHWIDEQRELNSLITPEMQRKFAENFDPEALTNSIIKKYSESDLYKRNQEIIEANRQIREKDNKIINLQNETKRNIQKKNVKNVLADK